MRERKATTEPELGRSMFGGRKNLGEADTSGVGNLSCSASAGGKASWSSASGGMSDAPLGENNGGLGRLVDMVRGIQKKVVEVKQKSS